MTAAIGAAAAGRGQLVVVEGPPGLGKTWLLKAALADARELGLKTLTARASELEREFDFGVVRQLLEPVVAAAGEQGAESLFAGGAAPARPLFEPGPAGAALAVDASCVVLHGLYRLLCNVADGAALTLTVDDLHWADDLSLRFLVFLLSRLEELPFALLVAMRDGETAENALAAQIASAPSAIALRPRPLSRSQVAELVGAALGREPEPEFTQECQAATAGNPLFLRALLREVSLRAIAPTDAQAVRVRSLAPPGVAHAARIRIAKVPDGVALARAVALLGDGAELRNAAALAGLEQGAATKTADLLSRASILRRARRLEFVHPIVRRAIYADIAPQERAAGHARAAKLLAAASAPPEQVARHLIETSPGSDRHVVAQLRSAAERALARGAPAAAIGFLRRALDEPPDRELRIDVLMELGSARCRIGELGGVDHLREAFQLADDPRSRALAARELAVVLGMSGRAAEALVLLEAAINSLSGEDRELSLELEAELAAVSKLDSSVAAATRARLASLRPGIAGATAAERRLLAELAWQDALQGVRADDVAALAERALRAPRWLLGCHGAPQYLLASRLLVCAERFDAADGYLRQAVAEARATGSQVTLASASAYRSDLAYRRGDVRQARTEAALAVDLQRGRGWGLGPVNALARLVDALIELGEIDHAERLLEQHGREIPDAIACNDLLDSRGALRLAQGRNADALADFREYARREHDWRARNPAFSAWRSRAAIALSALGDHDHAHELVAEELALARAYGAPRAIGIALRANGLIERGEAQLELLTQAVSTLERSGARLEHARALIDLGAATRRQGRRTDARQRLRTGLELAHACGATALTQRAREEFQALGDRSHHAAANSTAMLTPRERHVAQLAADGLTNPQIAQTLYVSLKTVETHLGHVYQKLGIQSRTQLNTTLTSAA